MFVNFKYKRIVHQLIIKIKSKYLKQSLCDGFRDKSDPSIFDLVVSFSAICIKASISFENVG